MGRTVADIRTATFKRDIYGVDERPIKKKKRVVLSKRSKAVKAFKKRIKKCS